MTTLRVTVEISILDRRLWRLSEEIDPGAIRFTAAIPLDRGAHVRLRFQLPSGAAVDTQGELADEHQISLDPAPPQRQAIEAYLVEQSES